MTGLRFQGRPGCTNCCRQKGFVSLTEADLARMAGFLVNRPGELVPVEAARGQAREIRESYLESLTEPEVERLP